MDLQSDLQSDFQTVFLADKQGKNPTSPQPQNHQNYKVEEDKNDRKRREELMSEMCRKNNWKQ